MNIVLKPSKKQIEEIKKDFAPFEYKKKQPYMVFFAKAPQCNISIYTSGKVMFQGAKASNIASKYGYENKQVDKKQINMVGTDEVGNGSYFGGLAVVASYVKEEDIPLLIKLGVDDSKNLTDEKILEIAPILEKSIENVQLLVSPKKYNEVIKSGYNAVSIKVALHNQSIFLLEQKLNNNLIDKIIIDAFTTENNYKKYLAKEKNQVKHDIFLIEKAESQYLAVAVSSIIARKLFLDNLKNLSKTIGYTLPSGASAKSDYVASQIIKNHGLESLNTLAKLHFKNTDKARKLAEH